MHEAPNLDMSDAQQVAQLKPVNAPVDCRVKKAFDAYPLSQCAGSVFPLERAAVLLQSLRFFNVFRGLQ